MNEKQKGRFKCLLLALSVQLLRHRYSKFLILTVTIAAASWSLVPAVLARDVYLAVRQDGHAGSGSAHDPFDASSAAKYDGILGRFRENTNFFYGPGIYETKGGYYRTRQTANPHCHHFGAGIDRTVIRLVGASHPTADGMIFYADYDATVDGFELHDLTLDCNATGNPKFRDGIGAVGAIYMIGNDILLSDLKIIHFGTGLKGVECFVVDCYTVAGHPGAHFRNVRLENSIITDPAIGNKDGLTSVVMGASSEAKVDGAVVNCRFVDIRSDFLYSHAFGAALCEGNDVRGCTECFYLEPIDHQNETFIVRNNRFRDFETAALIRWHPGGSINTIQFEKNEVILRAGSRRSSFAMRTDDIAVGAQDEHPKISKMIFRDNRIALDPSSTGTASQNFGLYVVSPKERSSIGELTLTNNVFDLPAGCAIVISGSKNVIGSCVQEANVGRQNQEILARELPTDPGGKQ